MKPPVKSRPSWKEEFSKIPKPQFTELPKFPLWQLTKLIFALMFFLFIAAAM